MFVCGGLTICWIVCCGVVIVRRKLRSCAGRHLRERAAVEAAAAAARRRRRRRRGRRRRRAPAAGAACRRRRRSRASFCEAGPDLRLLGRGRLEAHAAGDVEPSAARLELGDDLRDGALLVHAPSSTSPLETAGDAGERRDLLRLALRERQLRPGQEEVVDEVRARLAELREVGDRRLVRLEQLAAAAAAAAEPAAAEAAAGRPAAGASVTVRSVPMLESGSSAVFCAWSSPRESDEIAITSATPIASPSSVRIVRPLRREQLAAEVREVEHRARTKPERLRAA